MAQMGRVVAAVLLMQALQAIRPRSMGRSDSLNPEAMETRPRRLPDGWCHAINSALLAATTEARGGLLPQLLDGRRKALVVRWCGDLNRDTGDFLPCRGDGKVTLVQDHPLLPIPPNLGGGYRHRWNIRAAVPLWLVHPTGSGIQVLGCGAVHPLFNSATIDHFSPATGEYVQRHYVSDPRVKLSDPPPDFIDVREQMKRVWEMGGALDVVPPTHPPLLEWDNLGPGVMG